MLFNRWLFPLHSICPGFPGEERLYDDLNKEHSYNLLYPLPYEMHIFTWLREEPFVHSPRHIMPQNPKPFLLWFLFLFVCFCFPLEFADSTCRFFCSIYFAEQFRLLRKRIFADGEEKYELHFVIDYMNRSYETRKLLYSLIPRTPIPRPGGGGYTPEDF